MKLHLAGAAALALVAGGLIGSPAQAADAVIEVPDGFLASLSDTRATGHYEVVGSGLHVWTLGATSTDKVAEYFATDTRLDNVTSTGLDLTTVSGSTEPGYQLVVDLDNDGDNDGVLVGENAAYGGNWWLGGHKTFPVDSAVASNPATPKVGGGGGPLNGSLEQWLAAYGDAVVTAFGFSLGSGVHGDFIINSITFNDSTYTFAADSDDDGVADSTDNCPTVANGDQANNDGDSQGDVCDADDDNDTVADTGDNCPTVANGDQANNDGDSQGDVCDADDDNDGVADGADAFPLDYNESVDTDGDGTGNNADTDDDNDGVADGADAFPLDPSESVDTDGDGTGNNADTDDDGDGIQDVNDSNSKDDCKNGEWKDHTKTVFKNQGECVAFYTAKK